MRQLLPGSAIVGLSTHTKDEIEQSIHEAVTYVAVGPAYQTTTKDTATQRSGSNSCVMRRALSAGRLSPSGESHSTGHPV